ncbi:hypothetical protein B0H10DRAFT_1950668 [Mycena sp. CBHHK59/15]|nr:hypothetical protein B0H10DRAFT_1950668 [Mycena sp. CBHHK59/15]
MAATGVLCADCGLIFKNMDPKRANCFKCEKRVDCGEDQIALAAVECLDCGLVYKFLPPGRIKCSPCENKETGPKPSSSSNLKRDKENSKVEVKLKHPATSKTSKEVIDIDKDSDAAGDKNSSDSDVEDLDVSEISALQTKISQNKHAASGIRLTRKESEKPLPEKTREFLQQRDAARKRSTDHSKAATILFKVNVTLQKAAGQKQGTRVPLQSRGFPMDDKMENVFQKMVDMVNEPLGQWAKEYGKKTFKRSDVQFTFKDGMEIAHKYRTGKCTVATFWNAHSALNNQYFKKASVQSSIAEITMLVPIEMTLDPSDGEDEEDLDIFDAVLMGKRRHQKSKSSRKKRKVAIKKEDSDSDFVIKNETVEAEIPSTRSRGMSSAISGPSSSGRASTKRPLGFNLRHTTPIVFTREFYTNTLERNPDNTEELHGSRDLSPKSSPEMQTHFQLTYEGAHYLARRLETDAFQFAPELELDVARAELSRGHWLKALLQSVTEKYIADVPELHNHSTPDLFIATVKEQNTVHGHLVCQAKPYYDITQPTTPILDALSHYSFVQTKEQLVLKDFKGSLSSRPCDSYF